MAYAPDAAFTTSPCIKGFSAGLSLPGGAGTGGFSKTDKGCDSRQTAVIFHALGNDTAAAKLLCSTDASKRAKLTIDECLAIVRPPVPQIVLPAPPPAPQFNIVLPVPAPTPVSVVVPAPVAVPTPVEERKPVTVTPHVKRVCKSSVKIRSIGECILVNGQPSNICAPVLDNAITALASDPKAKIVLTGPVESATVVPYLKKHVKPSRIEIRLVDEQTTTLSVFTETGE
jgi:hypothetical protein